MMTRSHSLRWLIAAPLVLALFAAAQTRAGEPAGARRTENVLLVTCDGLRWQEVFDGCDSGLLNREFGGVRDIPALKSKYWREIPEERRAALLPFFWKMLATRGQIFGDPQHNSTARVTNGMNISYPGYNEILSGFADPRIDSNDKKHNPNVTVLEWLHRRPGFGGRVAAFASWDTFPFIINAPRSAIPVNAGWMPLEAGPDRVRLATLNDLTADAMRVWENVRDDGLTFHAALDYLKAKKPRVLFVSFGETDDWAHEGRYDLYLEGARRADRFVERMWNQMQSMPEYAGRTSLVLTTDHGRGDDRVGWKSHGKEQPESAQMWIAVLGPDTRAEGSRKDLNVMQSQVAATVAALLGEDYHAAVPESAAPLPGAIAIQSATGRAGK